MLAFALRTCNTGAWELDLTTRASHQTREHAAIFGYDQPQPDWGLAKFLAHVVPEERDEVARKIETFIATTRDWRVECRIRRADGVVRWIVVSAHSRGDGMHGTRLSGIVQDITERKEAEQALMVERNLLRTLIDTLPDLVIIKDLEGRYTVCNKAIVRLLGFEHESEMVGKTVFDVLEPGMAAIHDADDRSALSQLRTVFDEEPIVGADGQRRWYRPSRFPLHNSSGEVVGLVIVSADITARHEAEEELRASEERFRLLIEGVSGHAIIMLDPRGDILTWNSEAERIHSYTSEEAIGHHYALLYAADSVDDGLPTMEIEQATLHGKIEVEGWRVRKDGARFWADGTLAAIYDDERRVRGFAKVTRDLTDKRHNDELLKSVLSNTVDAIIGVDHRGTISFVNRATEEIFARSAEELVGERVNTLMPHALRREYEQEIEQMVRNGDSSRAGRRQEAFGLRKDGSTFPLELALTEFRLDNRRHFVGIVRDISDKKQLESQLHQSQKMDAFGQLAGGVAHDFNNLLTVISGYSEMLVRLLPSSERPWEMVEEIRRASDRAGSLTRQLLAFSRQQMLDPRVLDLNVVVESTEKLLRRVIGEDVELVTRLDRRIHHVKIDQGQIEQVVMNLAVNARDAMPQGGTLSIETAEVDITERDHSDSQSPEQTSLPLGKYIKLTVRDTGCGMPAEVRARVFEPFFTTKEVGRGTGLGLAVVHGIVKQSGGTIDVQSEVGVGATFTLYLPAVSGTMSAVGESQSTLATRGTETILLVEDETAVRDLAALALRAVGYHVIAATGSEDALELMRDKTRPVDLLVTDVVMPALSGSKLAELLVAQRPTLKVLFVSGYTTDAVVRHGVSHAEVSFLQKPFTPSSLAKKVREVLDGPST